MTELPLGMHPKADPSKYDEGQHRLHGGPYCYHFSGERDRYCGRAESWPGHGRFHDFVAEPIVTEQIRRVHPLATTCSSCRARIVWFKTLAGKKMPIDEASTRPTDRQDQLDLRRHISHFATCPNANQHRRAR